MTPEFSRPVRVAEVPAAGQSLSLRATEGELTALARRLGLPAMRSLVAELELRPAHGGRVRATGRLDAEIVQTCVVTLEDFPSRVEEPLDFLLLPPGEEPDEDATDDDAPDEVESGPLGADLGEAVAQTLSLALDPYPRKPGAELPAEDTAGAAPEDGPGAKPNPFASLARLRRPG